MAHSDLKTATAFANSWNNLPRGAIYTKEQYIDWMCPLIKNDIAGKNILELGCGNGSLMVHTLSWGPDHIHGIDLGDSVYSARNNLVDTGCENWSVGQDDLVDFASSGFDVVYCIGVLHHLDKPSSGFSSVIRNTKRGGKFHCWVYAKEGNQLVIAFVEPMRRVTALLPWRLTKYVISAPLALVFFCHTKASLLLIPSVIFDRLPLSEYCRWISARGYRFFWHVVFDQLVAPKTQYISYESIRNWINSEPRINQHTTYIHKRNGNSWKFGGTVE